MPTFNHIYPCNLMMKLLSSQGDLQQALGVPEQCQGAQVLKSCWIYTDLLQFFLDFIQVSSVLSTFALYRSYITVLALLRSTFLLVLYALFQILATPLSHSGVESRAKWAYHPWGAPWDCSGCADLQVSTAAWPARGSRGSTGWRQPLHHFVGVMFNTKKGFSIGLWDI